MTETDKLIALRQKLVAKRRALVESFQKTPPDQLTGAALARIQSAIDAVDRAIQDERHADSPTGQFARPATLASTERS